MSFFAPQSSMHTLVYISYEIKMESTLEAYRHKDIPSPVSEGVKSLRCC